MDIVRPRAKTRQRYIRTALYAVMGLSAILLITLWLSRLKPGAPGIERSTILIEAAQRGPMLRQVRGNGTLVPEEVRIAAARPFAWSRTTSAIRVTLTVRFISSTGASLSLHM